MFDLQCNVGITFILGDFYVVPEVKHLKNDDLHNKKNVSYLLIIYFAVQA